MIIAVDFDGTVVDHRYPEIGDLKAGAKDALKAFKKAGHKIAIWTCRAGKEELAVRQFLIQNDIPFDSINTAVPGTDLGTRKIYADVYIDDKALRFEDNWGEIKRLIGG
jgi:hydroxymethylpyrimidine pyrophosphatase-like HAD family hydrolase